MNKTNTKNMVAVYAMLGVLLIASMAGAVIHMPSEAVNVGECDALELSPQDGRWYTLRAEDYIVERKLGTETIGNGRRYVAAPSYVYYQVAIPYDENVTAIVIRVPQSDARHIDSGEQITIYGTATMTPKEIAEKLDSVYPINAFCINDSGLSLWSQVATFLILSMAAAVCAWLIVLVYRRASDPEIERYIERSLYA